MDLRKKNSASINWTQRVVTVCDLEFEKLKKSHLRCVESDASYSKQATWKRPRYTLMDGFTILNALYLACLLRKEW